MKGKREDEVEDFSEIDNEEEVFQEYQVKR